jgi:AraC-like DNA-binding protein
MALDDSRFWLAVFYNHFSPLMFLIGPLLYFYVRNTLYEYTLLRKKDWIHFLPAAIALIGSLPYILQPFHKKLEIANQIIQDLDSFQKIEINLFYDMGQSFALRCLLAFLYLIYSGYLVFKTNVKEKKKQYPKKQYLIIYRWIIIFLTCFMLLFVIFILLTFNAIETTPSETIKEGYYLYVLAAVLYSVMSFSLLLFPEILYGIQKKPSLNLTANKISNNPEEDPLYALSNKIVVYLEKEKPYLNYNFSISDISLHLQVPQKSVSYCITFLLNTKFSKLKNQLRVQHAIELLTESNLSTLTIESVGKQSGFKTRSNFYTAFKEETGVTPNEYSKKINK